MKALTIMLLLLGATDPMRPTNTNYVTNQSSDELQTCITRYWSQVGTVTPTPVDRGVALDFYTKGTFAGPGQSRISYIVRDLDDHRQISVQYRHPISLKGADRMLADTKKKCFANAEVKMTPLVG